MQISGPTWDKEFELPSRSYSVSDIQHYFECIIKNHETLTDNLPVQIYVNRIENRITFNIKTEYYLELSTPQTMKLLEGNQKKITIDKNDENAPRLEVTEVVLVYCTLVNYSCQHDSRVSYPIPNDIHTQ